MSCQLPKTEQKEPNVKLAFNPLAIEQRLRPRRVRTGLHLTTLDTLEVKRLRGLLIVKQILHHEEIGLCLHSPGVQVANFNCIKAEQFREYRRPIRGRIHMQEIGRRQVDENLAFCTNVIQRVSRPSETQRKIRTNR